MTRRTIVEANYGFFADLEEHVDLVRFPNQKSTILDNCGLFFNLVHFSNASITFSRQKAKLDDYLIMT